MYMYKKTRRAHEWYHCSRTDFCFLITTLLACVCVCVCASHRIPYHW